MADTRFESHPSPVPRDTGSHGNYEWLTTERDLEELLKLCPALVLGKYLAVTSRDGGTLNLGDSERHSGWLDKPRGNCL